MDAKARLEKIREKMRFLGIQAWIVPMNDPHQSEYVAPHWKLIPWLTGFTGSAATVVITLDFAGLWTDSRYFIQGEKELDGSGFQLMKLLVPHTPEYLDWLVDHLGPEDAVAIAGNLISIYGLERLNAHFGPHQIKVVTGTDALYNLYEGRPDLPVAPVFRHEAAFAGKTVPEKLQEIRDQMAASRADYHLLTALDDIAWTFNLRGTDVEFNPVFYAWAVIGKNDAHFFIQDVKLPTSLREWLESMGITIHGYNEIFPFLSNELGRCKLLLDTKKTSAALKFALPKEVTLVEGDAIPEKLKGIKNPTEIANARKVMERDGIALLKLYRWLEEKVQSGAISEARVGEKLAQIRASMPNYFGESFPAIAGFKGNGAIVHYRPDPVRSALLTSEGMFLLDSGGQYLDGTTDITRTTILGSPTAEQKFHYTLVLKGHIGLARARFPKGTSGVHISAFARQFLWRHGLNYGHGTGHGVGSFLCVHEGPQGISPALSGKATVPLAAGMITSNEPGFYLENQYGIRIENLVLTVESEIGDGFLEFETLSLFPIDTQLIDVNLLEAGEKSWLNEYHAEVLARLSPGLDEQEKAWLAAKCAPLK